MNRKTRKTRRQSGLQSGIPAQTGTVSDRLNKALDLHRQGNLDAACALYHSILQQVPEHFEALQLLGVLLTQAGCLPDALVYLDHALLVRWDQAEIHYNRAILLDRLGRRDEALVSYDHSIRLNPAFPAAFINKGALLQRMGRPGEALETYGQLSDRADAIAEFHNNRGIALKDVDRFDEAIAGYRKALEIEPRYTRCASNLLYVLAQDTVRRGADHYRLEAEQWERIALTTAERVEASGQRFVPQPRQGRPLRIGILSAELGQHAAACFLDSWLGHINPERIALHLYPSLLRSDTWSQAFQSLTPHWHPVVNLDDVGAVEQIRADGIDILMDVSGHTEHNRLGILARRAAPIQCHYIGFFASTGLSEMDYFLADEVLVPSALADQFVETVWRLPRPWLAYAPLENAPEPRWQAPNDGTVCLGSFNNLTKVREDCLDLWAQVMRALPEAWLLLKDGKATDATTRQRICNGLSRRGVDDRRVAFAARTASWQEHMALYDQVDIALDTLPLNSGTTAFDALWMGVPLITLAGNTMAGRMGAAIVAGMGQSDWIASNTDDYVAKVVTLARDLSLRKRLRPGQRERMRSSPLCDGIGLARVLEDTFESWFDRKFLVDLVQPEGIQAHIGSRSGRRDLHAGASDRVALPDPRSGLADIYVNRGNALQDIGNLVEAEASYRKALELSPHHPLYRSNLLFLMAYCPDRQSQATYRHEAMQWEQMSLPESARKAARQQTFVVPSLQDRPLRLGILSAEVGQHAVAHFLKSWLPWLDRSRISLYLYPTRSYADDKSQAFAALADVWCPVEDWDDEAATRRIRADRIDVLIETSGHTAHNRLGIIARRAAPVQCHYIGYFASTGLSEMDYFLADGTLIPNCLDHQFVERIWRLPRPWLAYTPLEEAPEPAWRPALDGKICLGSFNNLIKVRETCLEIWARLLLALPEAWLLLKDGRTLDETSRRRIRHALTARGVSDERIVFAERAATWREHMSQYDRVDIALDTVPLNSGTTAFDALWMGVPLITLAGDHMAGRMGAAIVAGIGKPDWITQDEDDYVTRVVALARDVVGRTRMRAVQREWMRASLLCDGADLADTLTDVFEQMLHQRTNSLNQVPP